MKSRLIILTILISLLIGCATAKKNNGITLYYFEYARGMSFPTHADVYMKYEGNDYTLSDIYMDDQSFFEDNSIIPNAFIKPLFNLKISDAVKAFTEPYYSYRLIHFFKNYSNFGIVMIRYYGCYANAHRGKKKKDGVDPSCLPVIEDAVSFTPSRGTYSS